MTALASMPISQLYSIGRVVLTELGWRVTVIREHHADWLLDLHTDTLLCWARRTDVPSGEVIVPTRVGLAWAQLTGRLAPERHEYWGQDR